jgi:hypothetical protein
MRFDRQLFDPKYLEYEYTLSALWGLREKLINFRDSLSVIQQKAANLFDAKKMVEIERQLSYVNQNIDRVEFIMINKENEIFVVTGMAEICLN